MENKQQRTAERRKEVTQWETKTRAKKEGGNTIRNKELGKEGGNTMGNKEQRMKEGGNTIGNKEHRKEGRRYHNGET